MGDKVKASKRMTSSGQVKNQNDEDVLRSTLCGVYAIGSSGLGKITLKDGNGSAATVLVLDVKENPENITIPMGGILFQNKMYATLSDISSVVFFYR